MLSRSSASLKDCESHVFIESCAAPPKGKGEFGDLTPATSLTWVDIEQKL
jgi:hypothetical protein